MPTILHISDLHFGKQHDDITANAVRKNCLDGVVRIVKNLDEDWKPSIICITGDFGWSGSDSDYIAAKQWLELLLSECSVGYEKVVVCAGNHEVNRKKAQKRARPSSAQEADEVLALPLGDTSQFDSFIKFCEDSGIPKMNTGTEFSHLVGERCIDNIRFLIFNSAWCSKDNNDEGKLWLGLPQMRVMESKGVMPLLDASNEKITVALIHHPFRFWHADECQATSERPNTMDYLAKRCHILLSGHTHGEIRDPDCIAKSAWHFAGGATYSGADYPNNFRLLRMAGNVVEYKSFEFDSRSVENTWQAKPVKSISLVSFASNQSSIPASGSSRLSLDWIKKGNKIALANIGERYTPEINVQIEDSKKFDAISLTNDFLDQLKNVANKTLQRLNNAAESFKKQYTQINIDEITVGIHEFEKYISAILNRNDISTSILALDCAAKNLHTLFISNINLCKTSQERKHESKCDSYTLNAALYALDEFFTFSEQYLGCAKTPFLLVTGEAGIGKSHLLAELVDRKSKSETPCIFVLGQLFTDHRDPWAQIFNLLQLPGYTAEQLLKELNEYGEARQERILFIIDAINEGRGLSIWPEHLRGFIEQFSSYPWIGLIVSIRETYLEAFFERNEPTNKLTLQGFSGIEDKASAIFFKHYGIQAPGFPLLTPEYSNPLFLKLLCSGLKANGQTTLPAHTLSFSDIINFFVENIEKRLSKPSRYNYNRSAKLVSKAIAALINHEVDNQYMAPSYDEATNIVNEAIKDYIDPRGFLDALIEEGLLAKNAIPNRLGRYDEAVYFAYERFDDFFIAESEIKKGNISTFVSSLLNGKQGWRIREGLFEALAIIMPQKNSIELFNAVDIKFRTNILISKATIRSLHWRDTRSISKETIDYIQEVSADQDSLFDTLLDVFYTVCCNPRHPFNSKWLHNILSPHSMADRDAFWTTRISAAPTDSSLYRFVEWTMDVDNVKKLSSESRFLAAITLAWFFTTTNLQLRNKATHGLVCVLENDIDNIIHILDKFSTVNDPYIIERIYTASYGAVLSSNDDCKISNVANYLLVNFFAKPVAHPNILVRDSAIGIVELAVFKKLTPYVDLTNYTSQFKSSFPENFPTNDEIDRLEVDYNVEPNYLSSVNSILQSMITEYSRGIGRYGDFGRYVFQHAVSGWKQFNPNDLSNYACLLILNTYGYDAKKHGYFDRNTARQTDRYNHQIERIGKKYQWIALHEIMARLADNYKCSEPYTYSEEPEETVWHNSRAIEPFLRQIDPSSGFPPVPGAAFPRSSLRYENWGGSLDEWVKNDSDFLNPKHVLHRLDENKTKWFALDLYTSWKEPLPIGEDEHRAILKSFSCYLQSYLVKKESKDIVTTAISKNSSKQLFNPPREKELYQIYLKEFFWSPTYHSLMSESGDDELKIHLTTDRRSHTVSIEPATIRYLWEKNIIHDKLGSCVLPCEHLFNGLELCFTQTFGSMSNHQDEVACLFTGVYGDPIPALLIRIDFLKQFLKDNDLCLLVCCNMEKSYRGMMAVPGIMPNEKYWYYVLDDKSL